jgi:hypothetical protein
MEKAVSKKAKWVKTAESPIEKQLKEVKDMASGLAEKINIKITIPDKPKENIEILRELTTELEKWDMIYTTKINLVKLQRFDLASEVRALENKSVDHIQLLAASLKSYPTKA